MATVEQGPTGDDDISMTMTNGLDQMSEIYKKFQYARATHSNNAIQYHMQQIIKKQKGGW